MDQSNRLRDTAYQSDGSGSDTYTLDAGSDRIVLFQISYVAASAESLSPTYGGNALTEVTGSPAGPSTAEADSLIYAVVGASDQNSSLTHGTGQTELDEAAFEFQNNPHAHTEEFKGSATTDTQKHVGDATTLTSSYSAIGVAVAPAGGSGSDSNLPLMVANTL